MVHIRDFPTLGRIAMRRNRWVQIGLLIGLWWLSDTAVRYLEIPVPGAVIGLAALLVLLISGWAPAAWFRRGTKGLLDHMLLFFLPAAMALLDHRDLFGVAGLKVVLAVVVGTVLVMVGTALSVEACFRWSARRAS
ncbi:MAG: CidA/LrgA family protein [Azospirillaceae bacterium]|nr:CidA/LrgA family protein [Azospirillaceae bacterium]